MLNATLMLIEDRGHVGFFDIVVTTGAVEADQRRCQLIQLICSKFNFL